MAKKKLGKGISALLSNMETEFESNPKETVSALSRNVAEVPIKHIRVNPFQPRQDFDREALEDLSASIKIHGLIQPLTVRRIKEDEYELISGERRLRASMMAGLEQVPAYIRMANRIHLIPYTYLSGRP